jgi:hypothetical protein
VKDDPAQGLPHFGQGPVRQPAVPAPLAAAAWRPARAAR